MCIVEYTSICVMLDIESFFFLIFTITYVCIYVCRGWCMRGMSLYNQVRLLTKADEYWERRLWVKGYKSDTE